ncbi:UNVERIFIED_CONTAM: hypothetical protein HDU68_010617 [Siphonaria sp. JEL0065]|nr:hypothetical protein HDU68_010617 [Siphonaria sp. JEL0065]
MREEAYELIHDSLVELENRDSKQEKSSEVEQLIVRVTGVLESLNVSNVKNVDVTGLSSVGKAFGLIETVDPTLIPTYDRLVHLKSALITLRKERDKAVAEKIRNFGGVFHFSIL